MKNKFTITAITLIIFATSLFMISGCKKENTPPVLTLNGDANMATYKGETFTYPGATANDNEDGNLTLQIHVEGSVGTETGIYILTYSITDKEGNYASVQRYVSVAYKSTSLAGTYNVTETSPFGTVNYVGTVTADSVDFAHFVFGSLSAPDPIVIDAQIQNRDNIEMLSDVQGGPIMQFQGSITQPTNITFSLSYLRPINSTTTNCTATWVKQ